MGVRTRLQSRPGPEVPDESVRTLESGPDLRSRPGPRQVSGPRVRRFGKCPDLTSRGRWTLELRPCGPPGPCPDRTPSAPDRCPTAPVPALYKNCPLTVGTTGSRVWRRGAPGGHGASGNGSILILSQKTPQPEAAFPRFLTNLTAQRPDLESRLQERAASHFCFPAASRCQQNSPK